MASAAESVVGLRKAWIWRKKDYFRGSNEGLSNRGGFEKELNFLGSRVGNTGFWSKKLGA